MVNPGSTCTAPTDALARAGAEGDEGKVRRHLVGVQGRVGDQVGVEPVPPLHARVGERPLDRASQIMPKFISRFQAF